MLNHFSAKLPKLSKLITGGHLDWLGPKWFKIVPKLSIWSNGPEIIQNGTETDNLEHPGGLASEMI